MREEVSAENRFQEKSSDSAGAAMSTQEFAKNALFLTGIVRNDDQKRDKTSHGDETPHIVTDDEFR